MTTEPTWTGGICSCACALPETSTTARTAAIPQRTLRMRSSDTAFRRVWPA